MAIATGLAVANIYYNQPMLGVIEAAFPDSPLAALVPTATQIGYALGLVFLVPLGDLFERRLVIVIQFGLLTLALAAAALAPGAGALLGASILIGFTATVAQQIVPMAALLSAPEERGRSVGLVMSGLLSGILLSRTLSGFVASQGGWRTMFWVGVPMALAGTLAMRFALPHSRPNLKVRYPALIASLLTLWQEEPRLRRATLGQACLFASFSAYWTTLALYLEGPHYRAGSEVAGLFGLVGIVGVMTAPRAGRMADRTGPEAVIRMGALVAVLSWLAFAAWRHYSGLVVGTILLDLGVQASLVSNQHVIYSLNPEARNRLNTIFVTGMFVGGAAGSSLAVAAWHQFGWSGVCTVGAGGGLIALAVGMAYPNRRSDRAVE